jgi:SAM-dependent methyltransferase
VIADNIDMISEIMKYSGSPRLFEPGESRFWDDPHISKGMLTAHLDPESDAASRKHTTIDKDVDNLLSSGFLRPGDRVLDLGCGPGLYCSRLAERGLLMTGVDISERSLDYARRHALERGLKIDYRLMNFFDIDFSGEFDAVIQCHGELNTFSDEKLKGLLSRLHWALKHRGLLIFDSSTREVRVKVGLKNRWYVSESGYWRPGPFSPRQLCTHCCVIARLGSLPIKWSIALITYLAFFSGLLLSIPSAFPSILSPISRLVLVTVLLTICNAIAVALS